jgi:hypothetical protein
VKLSIKVGNVKRFCEWRIEKDVEGSGRGLVQRIILELLGGAEVVHTRAQSV